MFQLLGQIIANLHILCYSCRQRSAWWDPNNRYPRVGIQMWVRRDRDIPCREYPRPIGDLRNIRFCICRSNARMSPLCSLYRHRSSDRKCPRVRCTRRGGNQGIPIFPADTDRTASHRCRPLCSYTAQFPGHRNCSEHPQNGTRRVCSLADRSRRFPGSICRISDR